MLIGRRTPNIHLHCLSGFFSVFLDIRPGAIAVGWWPFFADAGLVVVLFVIVFGIMIAGVFVVAVAIAVVVFVVFTRTVVLAMAVLSVLVPVVDDVAVVVAAIYCRGAPNKKKGQQQKKHKQRTTKQADAPFCVYVPSFKEIF